MNASLFKWAHPCLDAKYAQSIPGCIPWASLAASPVASPASLVASPASLVAASPSKATYTQHSPKCTTSLLPHKQILLYIIKVENQSEFSPNECKTNAQQMVSDCSPRMYGEHSENVAYMATNLTIAWWMFGEHSVKISNLCHVGPIDLVI